MCSFLMLLLLEVGSSCIDPTRMLHATFSNFCRTCRNNYGNPINTYVSRPLRQNSINHKGRFNCVHLAEIAGTKTKDPRTDSLGNLIIVDL